MHLGCAVWLLIYYRLVVSKTDYGLVVGFVPAEFYPKVVSARQCSEARMHIDRKYVLSKHPLYCLMPDHCV